MTDIYHRHFDSIASTNTQLLDDIAYARCDSHVPILYTADHQTAGRGQHGRTWVSGAGNVLLSLYVPFGVGDNKLAGLTGLLSLAVALSVADLAIIKKINELRHHLSLPVIGVKWANDVGFFDIQARTFKKLAGILIEPAFIKQNNQSTAVGVVIGVGLNVAHAPVIADGIYQATCLHELSMVTRHFNDSTDDDMVTTHTALHISITEAILHAVRLCNGFDNSKCLHEFIAHFDARHVLHGRMVAIYTQDDMQNIHAQGKCIGIGKHGQLLLQANSAVKEIYAGLSQIIA